MVSNDLVIAHSPSSDDTFYIAILRTTFNQVLRRLFSPRLGISKHEPFVEVYSKSTSGMNWVVDELALCAVNECIVESRNK